MHSLGKGVYINLQNQTDQQETIKNNKLFNHELSTSIRRHRMRVIKKMEKNHKMTYIRLTLCICGS